MQRHVDGIDTVFDEVGKDIEHISAGLEEDEFILGMENFAVFAIQGLNISRHISREMISESSVPQSSCMATPLTSVLDHSSISQENSCSIFSKLRTSFVPRQGPSGRHRAAQKTEAIEWLGLAPCEHATAGVFTALVDSGEPGRIESSRGGRNSAILPFSAKGETFSSAALPGSEICQMQPQESVYTPT